MATFDRRDFIKGAVILGSGSIAFPSGAALAQDLPTPEMPLIQRNDWVPNNPRLPVLHYSGVITQGDVASELEALFAHDGWMPQWRNSNYDYHHYHSTAYEILGFAAGSAGVMLGGPNGHVMNATKRDVVLLPTGIGHCRLWVSNDFLVVGAYTLGQEWDICRQAPTDAILQRMATLPSQRQILFQADNRC